MASNTFHLTIASVGEQLFDGGVSSATFPGAEGELTVLAHHEPLVTTLAGGTITVRSEGAEAREFSVKSGILEISGNRAVVLL
ncbi:MAG TPA: F0F1 ATP synthase subunit epsilon [Candidatus Paceibacterota bacterium]